MSESITVGDVTITPTADGGIIVKHDGGNRAITAAELEKLAQVEGPVTIQ